MVLVHSTVCCACHLDLGCQAHESNSTGFQKPDRSTTMIRKFVKGAVVGTISAAAVVVVAVADEVLRARKTARDAGFRSNVGRWSRW